jgi:hypothetical protein
LTAAARRFSAPTALVAMVSMALRIAGLASFHCCATALKRVAMVRISSATLMASPSAPPLAERAAAMAIRFVSSPSAASESATASTRLAAAATPCDAVAGMASASMACWSDPNCASISRAPSTHEPASRLAEATALRTAASVVSTLAFSASSSFWPHRRRRPPGAQSLAQRALDLFPARGW